MAEATDLSEQRPKGICYAIILHILAFFFLFSVFRTIYTNPGGVTKVIDFSFKAR